MAGNRAIKISVLANTRQFKKELHNLGDATGFNKLRAGLGKVGAALKQVTALGAAATAAIATAGIKAASDLEQSTGTIDDIFKRHAGVVHRFAKNAAKDVGLSANSYNELAAIISTQLKNGGTAMDDLAGKSNELISLGADLSAGFGGSTVDAVNAISSALKGERDPIERYGVSLKQTTIDAKAAALGFTKVGNSFSNEAQQAATLSLIMEQTADFHGKFARENDTLAHKVQVLKAQFTNISATIGSYLIPAVTAVVGWISDNLQPAFERLSAWTQENLTPAIEQVKAKFVEWWPTLKQIATNLAGKMWQALQSVGNFITDTVIPAVSSLVTWSREHSTLLVGIAGFISGVVAAYKVYEITMATVKVVTTGVTLAQSALNVVMKANPIGVVILAITGLVAAFTALWNYSDSFRAFWQGVWKSITDAVQSVVSWFSRIPGTISGYMSRMASGVSAKIGDVVSFFSSMPSRILGALGNLGNLLWDAGKSVIRGFVNGLKSAFGWVKDSLSSLTSWLPDWKGPAKRDAVILKKSGQLVIGGFVQGLESQYGNVRRSLTGFTNALPGMVDGDLRSSISLSGNLAPQQPQTVVYVSFKTLDTTVEAGRKLMKIIEEYVRHNGRDGTVVVAR
ncbi:phage tail protein [Arcanobacterium haemolyticum]